MKIKDDMHPITTIPAYFTGVLELCDGVIYTSKIRITHYKNGKKHRIDGPADEFVHNEFKLWFLKGGIYTELQWKSKKLKEY
jgi:hypothetical protein